MSDQKWTFQTETPNGRRRGVVYVEDGEVRVKPPQGPPFTLPAQADQEVVEALRAARAEANRVDL